MRNKELVVVFPVLDSIGEKFVLLGKRQKDPWKGCFSGFGGNIEESDQNPRQRQILELKQEAGCMVQEQDLIKMAEFVLDIQSKEPKLLHVYITNEFKGRCQKTKEMHPKWFSFRDLPIHKMIKGDEFWVPRILAGEYLTGIIFRDAELNFLDIDVKLSSPRFFK